MDKKTKFSVEEKLNAINEYLQGKNSIYSIANRLGIDDSSLERWVRNYQAMGIDAFATSCKGYSKEEKEQAVTAYLAGEGSLREICKRFKIRSTIQLRNWIKKYNSHEELKASKTGGIAIMTKGRTSTFTERVEIASYCINHDHNYSETAEKFNVSYQQARNYTIKYEKNGIQSLQDNRGKRKNQNDFTK